MRAFLLKFLTTLSLIISRADDVHAVACIHKAMEKKRITIMFSS